MKRNHWLKQTTAIVSLVALLFGSTGIAAADAAQQEQKSFYYTVTGSSSVEAGLYFSGPDNAAPVALITDAVRKLQQDESIDNLFAGLEYKIQTAGEQAEPIELQQGTAGLLTKSVGKAGELGGKGIFTQFKYNAVYKSASCGGGFGDLFNLYSIDAQGNMSLLTDDEISSVGAQFEIYKDTIYYLKVKSSPFEGFDLMKLASGNAAPQTVAVNVQNFSISGNTLYLVKGNGLLKSDLDGKNVSPVAELNGKLFNMSGCDEGTYKIVNDKGIAFLNNAEDKTSFYDFATGKVTSLKSNYYWIADIDVKTGKVYSFHDQGLYVSSLTSAAEKRIAGSISDIASIQAQNKQATIVQQGRLVHISL